MKDLIIQIFGTYEPVMSTQAVSVPLAEGGSTLETVEVVAPAWPVWTGHGLPVWPCSASSFIAFSVLWGVC